jgi:hypothetical protein
MTIKFRAIEAWLRPLEDLPLECDALSRAISAILLRESLRHEMHVGSMDVDSIGQIGLHFWVSLEGGWICDFRARMWLGNKELVPHGVFQPNANCRYVSTGNAGAPLSPTLFHILCGQSLDDFPPFVPGARPYST